MANAKNKSVAKRSRWLLLLGFAFFINPTPLGLDLIPDAFGCLLIFFGLTQLAYFDGAVENAKRGILYLFIAEAVRLLLMRSVFMTNIGSNRMLAVTGFSIVEGILYLMIIRNLFGGIEYFSMRNNCNQALAKCDGCAFLTYLAFFVRIAATLVPELFALLEIYMYDNAEVEIDFDTLDVISELLNSKVIVVVLFSFISFVTSVAWFVSFWKLIKTFYSEASETLDSRYYSEYSSRPEMVRPRKLRKGCWAIYIAIFFIMDLSFDGMRIIPASAMFFGLFIATWFFKGLGDFRKTRVWSIPAGILMLATEIFRSVTVPNGAIRIYETDLWIVAVGGIMTLVAAPLCLLCVRSLLLDLSNLSQKLGGERVVVTIPWALYCVMLTLWAAGFIVPYYYSYISTLRAFCAFFFIWQTVKIVGGIYEDECERVSLYGKK